MKLITKKLDNYQFIQICEIKHDLSEIKNITIISGIYVDKLIFDTDKNIIIVETYSPYLDKYEMSPENYLSLEY